MLPMYSRKGWELVMLSAFFTIKLFSNRSPAGGDACDILNKTEYLTITFKDLHIIEAVFSVKSGYTKSFR